MANAETYKGAEPPFFPLQGPRVQRGNDVRIPTDAANVEHPPISKRLTPLEEDTVWAHYEAMPPSTDDMKKASNVGESRRWLIPAIVGAACAVGIGYAVLTERPAAIDEAARETPATATSASALMGDAPMAGAATVSTQSTFDSSQPVTVSPPPLDAAPAPGIATTEPAAEPVTPAPTYLRGDAPATTLPTPASIPDAGNPDLNPSPLPGAPPQEPALNLDLAPPSERVPAPGAVPENAQTPQ